MRQFQRYKLQQHSPAKDKDYFLFLRLLNFRRSGIALSGVAQFPNKP